MSILERIVASKREEVARLRPRASVLREAAARAPAPRPFARALRRGGEVAVIAEIKRRSPSAGWLRPELSVTAVAEAYAGAGAAALSVLTDGEYFGGSLEDLQAVRSAVSLPVLRKDFVVDPLQVEEARAAGADAVLLIVRILDDVLLADLLALAGELELGALVEVHTPDELERALRAGAHVIGVNNRDLASFRTDLAVVLGLADSVPPGRVLVAESGIRTAADVDRLGAAGADAVLVGETFMRAPDPGAAAAELVGRARRARGGARGEVAAS
ncbi:MAG TPA: indole-3-glycerol phosphate synthase TrpC [Longimicrobiales bacterium]